jgi:hypothetical protein
LIIGYRSSAIGYYSAARSAALCSAFSRGFCVKRLELRYYLGPFTARTLDLLFLVLGNTQGNSESLIAFLTEIFVEGHGVPFSFLYQTNDKKIWRSRIVSTPFIGSYRWQQQRTEVSEEFFERKETKVTKVEALRPKKSS